MASPSRVPMEHMPAPTFLIYRPSPPGQAYDPTIAPVFFPPKDSDELFDALRAKYPHVKTHSERMRDAMIDFLVQERLEQQAAPPAAAPPASADCCGALPVSDPDTASPWPPLWPSMSSGSTSTLSSPETQELGTPRFGTSPQIQLLQKMDRQSSASGSTTASSPAAAPTPHRLEQMTGVFSVSASAQPKQRVRRKMTDAEKVEYRKRRLAKACDKCAKRKRKCQHNHPDADLIRAPHKVSKPTQPSQVTNPPAIRIDASRPPHIGGDPDAFSFDEALFNADTLFDTDMQLFDDFTTVSKEPEYGLDQVWPSDEFDWNSTTNGTTYDERPLDQLLGVGATTGGRNLQTDTSANNANSHEALRFDQFDQNGWNPWMGDASLDNLPARDGQLERQQRHSDDQPASLTEARQPPFDQQPPLDQQPTARLWDDSHAGQDEPTHTTHVRDAESGDSYVFDSAGRAGSDDGMSPHDPQASWSQTVLRLTGVRKAIQAFAKGSKSRTTRASLQSVSLRKVALLVSLEVARGVAQLHGHAPASQIARDHAAANLLTPPFLFNSALAQAGAPRSWRGRNDLKDGSCRGDAPDRYADNLLRADSPAACPPERLAADNGFRTGTNLYDVRPLTQWLAPSPLMRRPGGALLHQEPASTSAPVSRRPEESTPHQQGRPIPTLGEGIDHAPSLKSTMFMLRRRIPSALHSPADHDHRRGSNNTRLVQTESRHQQGWEVFASDEIVRRDAITARANGGAYLRLDAHSYTRPETFPGSGEASAPASAHNRPVHTRPRDPIASRSSGDPGQLRRPSTAASRTSRAQQQVILAGADWNGVNRSEEDGRSDDVRARDHFDRPVASEQPFFAGLPGEVAVGLALLAGALLLSFVLPHVRLDTALLLPVLIAPVNITGSSRAVDGSWKLWSQARGTIVQCTTKNSTWLSGLRRAGAAWPLPYETRARCERIRPTHSQRQRRVSSCG